jgi:phenylalanyl-tRNA synthetase beta chain
MKIPFSWLKHYLETTATVDEIGEALVSLGHEVEEIIDPSKDLEPFIIAKVVSFERHPNADRLNVCKVDMGKGDLLQIVCGASNVREGLITVLAREGNVIPSTGEPLKKGSIRGVESQGMLCSAAELCLGGDSEGIMDLETSLPPGTPLLKVINWGDATLEVSLTPNRGDCFSLYGMARDLAAKGFGTLKPLPTVSIPISGPDQPKVNVETTDCRKFFARKIEGINNQVSPPLWMKAHLEAAGQKSISPVVDITNFICLALGRPLHAYDAQKIEGELIVRSALENETLLTLEDKEIPLEPSMVVIADQKGPLALGGIMGGLESACTPETSSIILESAWFEAKSIALAGQKLAILSESRTRFERGIDPELVAYGLEYATQLILEICGGRASEAFEYSQNAQEEPAKEILLPLNMIEEYLGVTFSLPEIEEILTALGFIIIKSSDQLIKVAPPSWRHDITIPQDIIEELARIKGYESIAEVPLPLKERDVTPDLKHNLRKSLSSRGLFEVLSWSMTSEEQGQTFGGGVALSSPLNNEMAVLRPSLLASLLPLVQKNLARSQNNFGFFEIARQFESGPKDNLHQPLMVSGILIGKALEKSWNNHAREFDVFDVKADVFSVLETLGLNPLALTIEPQGPSYYHPGRVGSIKQGPKTLAYFGEVHPVITKKNGIKSSIMAFEIFLEGLMTPKDKKKNLAVQFSPYQPVEQDFGFLMERSRPVDDLLKALQKVDRQIIKQVDLFDVYEGEKVESGFKSVAVRIIFQSDKGTLKEEELKSLRSKIIESADKGAGARLREQ